MKRAVLGIWFAMFMLVVLYGSTTNAVNRTHEERFLVNGKTIPDGETGTYNFDKNHTVIAFKAKHNGLIEIPGFFRDFTGAVVYDAKDPSKSSVTFTAKATSIDTGVANRDNHLRNADFFEVEKYPELTFKSTKVEKRGNDWAVTGDLTMKGVTKSVTIPFNLTGFLPGGQRSGPRMGITAATTLNRRDYGVNWGGNIPGTSTPVVADNIDIVLQIEAVQPRATPAATPTPAE